MAYFRNTHAEITCNQRETLFQKCVSDSASCPSPDTRALKVFLSKTLQWVHFVLLSIVFMEVAKKHANNFVLEIKSCNYY